MTAEGRERQAIRWAKATARRMWRPGVHGILYEDVEGAALLGAAKALAQWDPARGVQFSSYAITMIRCEIQEATRQEDYLTRHARREARQVYEETGEYPEWASEPVSIEELSPAGVPFEEWAAAPDDTEAEALANLEREQWARVLRGLPENARYVYHGRYVQDETWSDLSRSRGRSTAWAQKCARHYRDRLRAWAEAAGLAP